MTAININVFLLVVKLANVCPDFCDLLVQKSIFCFQCKVLIYSKGKTYELYGILISYFLLPLPPPARRLHYCWDEDTWFLCLFKVLSNTTLFRYTFCIFQNTVPYVAVAVAVHMPAIVAV